MDQIGEQELEILNSFHDFSDLIEKIQGRPEFKTFDREGIHLPEYEAENLILLVGLLYKMCNTSLVLKAEDDKKGLNAVNRAEIEGAVGDAQRAMEKLDPDLEIKN